MRIGIEFWTSDNKMLYLAFQNSKDWDFIYNNLLELGQDIETESSLIQNTEKWVKGELSNYEYLLKLNSISYWSWSDLT